MFSISDTPVSSQVTAPLEPLSNALEPHNAHLVSPRGNRISVNISPEAAVVWTRYGFTVEWFAVLKAVA